MSAPREPPHLPVCSRPNLGSDYLLKGDFQRCCRVMQHPLLGERL